MNILQILSSARGDQSHSSGLAQAIVDRLRAGEPHAEVTRLDLVRQPHPELGEAALQALFTPADQRTPEQAARVALDDARVAELKRADVLVIGVPMYNFGVPAQLKHWIDAIARAGVTFRYTANGPEGLLSGTRVIIALTRGGIYRDQPTDTQVPYLRSVFSFIGLTDIHFVYAEGLALGDEAAAASLADARRQIEALLPVEATA